MAWIAGFQGSNTAWYTGLLLTDVPVNIGNGIIGGGSFSVSLNVLEYGVGPQLARTVQSNSPLAAFGDFVDMSGQGGLLSIPNSEKPTPYDLFNNVDFTIDVVSVPEPNIMSIFGLGLLGLWGVGRRRLTAASREAV